MANIKSFRINLENKDKFYGNQQPTKKIQSSSLFSADLNGKNSNKTNSPILSI